MRGDVTAIQDAIRAANGPVLVNFWATWCVPCVEEMPALDSLRTEFSGRGFEIVGVSTDLFLPGEPDTIEGKVRRFLAKGDFAWPNVLYDGRQDPLFEAFDLPGPIPVSLLFSREGKETRRWLGMIDVKEARDEVAKLVAPAPSG